MKQQLLDLYDLEKGESGVVMQNLTQKPVKSKVATITKLDTQPRNGPLNRSTLEHGRCHSQNQQPKKVVIKRSSLNKQALQKITNQKLDTS